MQSYVYCEKHVKVKCHLTLMLSMSQMLALPEKLLVIHVSPYATTVPGKIRPRGYKTFLMKHEFLFCY